MRFLLVLLIAGDIFPVLPEAPQAVSTPSSALTRIAQRLADTAKKTKTAAEQTITQATQKVLSLAERVGISRERAIQLIIGATAVAIAGTGATLMSRDSDSARSTRVQTAEEPAHPELARGHERKPAWVEAKPTITTELQERRARFSRTGSEKVLHSEIERSFESFMHATGELEKRKQSQDASTWHWIATLVGKQDTTLETEKAHARDSLIADLCDIIREKEPNDTRKRRQYYQDAAQWLGGITSHLEEQDPAIYKRLERLHDDIASEHARQQTFDDLKKRMTIANKKPIIEFDDFMRAIKDFIAYGREYLENFPPLSEWSQHVYASQWQQLSTSYAQKLERDLNMFRGFDEKNGSILKRQFEHLQQAIAAAQATPNLQALAHLELALKKIDLSSDTATTQEKKAIAWYTDLYHFAINKRDVCRKLGSYYTALDTGLQSVIKNKKAYSAGELIGILRQFEDYYRIGVDASQLQAASVQRLSLGQRLTVNEAQLLAWLEGRPRYDTWRSERDFQLGLLRRAAPIPSSIAMGIFEKQVVSRVKGAFGGDPRIIEAGEHLRTATRLSVVSMNMLSLYEKLGRMPQYTAVFQSLIKKYTDYIVQLMLQDPRYVDIDSFDEYLDKKVTNAINSDPRTDAQISAFFREANEPGGWVSALAGWATKGKVAGPGYENQEYNIRIKPIVYSVKECLRDLQINEVADILALDNITNAELEALKRLFNDTEKWDRLTVPDMAIFALTPTW